MGMVTKPVLTTACLEALLLSHVNTRDSRSVHDTLVIDVWALCVIAFRTLAAGAAMSARETEMTF